MLEFILKSTGITRIIIVIMIAIGSHLIVLSFQRIGIKILSARLTLSFSTIRTIFSLLISTTIFIMYFVAFGLILKEFGLSLKAYMTSASIIGLAVGFGAQGLVQDIVTGLTIVFSNLFHIGDMVEIGGQTGIVKEFGIRFTVLTNYMGAEVNIPNRSIVNVINYPRGYIRGIAEIRLPVDKELSEKFEKLINSVVQASYERFSGLMIRKPSIENRYKTALGKEFLRIKFRIWPGQGTPLENYFKREVAESFKEIDSSFAEWMVIFNYEVEKKEISI